MLHLSRNLTAWNSLFPSSKLGHSRFWVQMPEGEGVEKGLCRDKGAEALGGWAVSSLLSSRTGVMAGQSGGRWARAARGQALEDNTFPSAQNLQPDKMKFPWMGRH